jgi:hypothetical protein
VVSTVHPRREIGEFEKPVATSAESPQAPNQTPVVVNNSGWKHATKKPLQWIHRSGFNPN